ncbi:hypothetical protein [Kocuria sp.]|uniref:hypothetical protein n=1 Tax=Kocuria sp. TaxID=1871328 RepID=UPI0026DEDEE2|nr:hypothetical protein [Kocuria sp.]MDO5617153.1 hypothetical protein [Kocuria sp.]
MDILNDFAKDVVKAIQVFSDTLQPLKARRDEVETNSLLFNQYHGDTTYDDLDFQFQNQYDTWSAEIPSLQRRYEDAVEILATDLRPAMSFYDWSAASAAMVFADSAVTTGGKFRLDLQTTQSRTTTRDPLYNPHHQAQGLQNGKGPFLPWETALLDPEDATYPVRAGERAVISTGTSHALILSYGNNTLNTKEFPVSMNDRLARFLNPGADKMKPDLQSTDKTPPRVRSKAGDIAGHANRAPGAGNPLTETHTTQARTYVTDEWFSTTAVGGHILYNSRRTKSSTGEAPISRKTRAGSKIGGTALTALNTGMTYRDEKRKNVYLLAQSRPNYSPKQIQDEAHNRAVTNTTAQTAAGLTIGLAATAATVTAGPYVGLATSFGAGIATETVEVIPDVDGDDKRESIVGLGGDLLEQAAYDKGADEFSLEVPSSRNTGETGD